MGFSSELSHGSDMPFFGGFGSKKKSKSTLGLSDGSSDPGWGSQREGFNTLPNRQGERGDQDRRIINKLEKINNDLEEKNEQLEEENNMLKLKVDILLDMLAQKTAETSMQEGEIERLQTAVQMAAPDSLTCI